MLSSALHDTLTLALLMFRARGSMGTATFLVACRPMAFLPNLRHVNDLAATLRKLLWRELVEQDGR